MNDKLLLTKSELLRLLGISKSTLDRLRSAGQAPPVVSLDGRPRWRVRDVERWLEKQRAR